MFFQHVAVMQKPSVSKPSVPFARAAIFGSCSQNVAIFSKYMFQAPGEGMFQVEGGLAQELTFEDKLGQGAMGLDVHLNQNI